MNSADLTLRLLSGVTRRLPYFRGLGTIYRKIHGSLVKFSKHPVVSVKMKNGTAMLIDLRTSMDIDAYYRGEYDSDLLGVVCKVADPNSYILDIGANIGFYSVAIASWLKSSEGTGCVMAFEPFEPNFRRLVENINCNKLSEHCQAINIGLSNESGETHVVLAGDFDLGAPTGNTAIGIAGFQETLRQVPITLEKLDTIWQNLPDKARRIDFVKMDIEGHEDFCLQGAQKVLHDQRPTVLMEVNKPYYAARGVDLDETFLPLLPPQYSIFRKSDGKWTSIDSLIKCRELDNVFLIPDEKRSRSEFSIFS